MSIKIVIKGKNKEISIIQKKKETSVIQKKKETSVIQKKKETSVIQKKKETSIIQNKKPKIKFKLNEKESNLYFQLYSKNRTETVPSPMRGEFYYDLKSQSYLISDPTGYYVSEKLDGVRAIWDPPNLKNRQNLILPAPPEFLANFPSNMSLDGELYIKRNYFPQTLSAVRSSSVQVWLTEVRYHVFDIPDSGSLSFEEVQKVLQTSLNSPYIMQIQQIQIKSRAHLQQIHGDLVQKGAEGTMLRKAGTSYEAGPRKTRSILKYKGVVDLKTGEVKHVLDELVEVIGYKYDPTRDNRIKSIWVRWQDKEKYPYDPTFAVYHNLTREQLDNARTLYPITCILRITFNEIFGSSQKPRYPRFDSVSSAMDQPRSQG